MYFSASVVICIIESILIILSEGHDIKSWYTQYFDNLAIFNSEMKVHDEGDWIIRLWWLNHLKVERLEVSQQDTVL